MIRTVKEPSKRTVQTGPRTIFKVRDVARWCDVDTKTVRSWCEKTAIVYLKTPGGHHRFTRDALVKFFTDRGWPLPTELKEVTT